ncbi:MAG TPA: glycosyltransferase family 9 protein, partial [Puia sp.]|nr:glycosyltransferase family 9 protein [Puia sp.]
LRRIRRTKYDKVINVQRFSATGLLTAFSGARETIGFDKNPLSRLFSRRIRHVVSYQPGIPVQNAASDLGNTPIPEAAPARSGSDHLPAHEIDRNQLLIKDFTDPIPARPRLYPAQKDYDLIREYQPSPYITISPASVWFTKQYPAEKWTGFIKKLPSGYTIFLLGAPSDLDLCEKIQQVASMQDPVSSEQLPYRQSASPQPPTAPAQPIFILAGRLNFLQSLALMQGAAMNYTNDSAPMHFASAGNAPVTAIYCSTIPAFGFGPLSDKRFIVEIEEPLDCRPCGLHGYKACPLGHFKCALLIKDEQLLATLP